MDYWSHVRRLVDSWVGDIDRDHENGAAWEELEAFLRRDEPPRYTPRPPRKESRAEMPPEVRQAFADLEIAPDSAPERVKRAYRKQLIAYHPDRFSTNERKRLIASQVTQRLTRAYQTVVRYQKG